MHPCFFWKSYTYHSGSFFSGSFSLYISTVQPGPFGSSLSIQRFCSTHVFKPPTLLLPTSYLLPLHLPYPLMFLAVFLYLLLPLLTLTRSEFFNEMRRSELVHFISSYPVDLICIQESNLNSSSSSISRDFLLYHLIALTPGMAFVSQ